jgi:hypothetical protein
VGLSAIRASPTRNGVYDLDLFTGTGVLDKVPDVDDAIVAGVGVILVIGCRVEGIAGWRYALDVHSASPFLWAGSRGVGDSCGAIYVLDNVSKIQDNTANVNVCPQKGA